MRAVHTKSGSWLATLKPCTAAASQKVQLGLLNADLIGYVDWILNHTGIRPWFLCSFCFESSPS
jgi:hypothetical protein